MPKLIARCFAAIFLLAAVSFVQGQTSTYILLRHAEKDTSASGSTMMTADPPLSKQGEQRAQRLLTVLKAYKPDLIYSTNYTRTKSTVGPLAKKFGKEILLYDPKNLQVMADQLLRIQGKTVIVAGHSNTTPALVNLLIRENKYEKLAESVYNRLWIVTITDGKATVKGITY